MIVEASVICIKKHSIEAIIHKAYVDLLKACFILFQPFDPDCGNNEYSILP